MEGSARRQVLRDPGVAPGSAPPRNPALLVRLYPADIDFGPSSRGEPRDRRVVADDLGELFQELVHSPSPLGRERVDRLGQETLETHLPSLVLDDENARREHAVYVGLSKDLRQAAVLLQASGAEMERARDLPEAEHDARKLASPDARDAFGRFMRAEETLASLLGQRLEADRAMTRQMDEAPARG
jgi:hypothetical protein